MKRRTVAFVISTMAFASAAPAALSIVADATTPMTISSVGSSWNTVTFPPSNLANIYWDANTDGIFGNSAGENTGNTAGTLPFTIPVVVSGTSYLFGMEGFGGAGTTGNIVFTLTNTDLSTQALNVTEGTTTFFSDSNGDPWQADFVFNNSAYGDVVFNGGVGGTGANIEDHQGVLTLTQIPEPSIFALLGLAGLALFRRGRR